MLKVLVVGAGPAGLILSYLLAKIGENVSIVEKSNQYGGLLKTTNIDGVEIEEVYHHILFNDEQLLKLIGELGLQNSLRWYKSRVALFTHNNFYDITTPANYLGLKFIPFLNRFKLILKLAFPDTEIKSLKEFFTEDIYGSFIEDMLINKFRIYANNVSPQWFIHKLKKRGRSRCLFYERPGYLNGSFKIFVDKIVGSIEKNGGKIILNSTIDKIIPRGLQFVVEINNRAELFDKIIFTISPFDIANLLKDINPEFSNRLFQLEFMSNITLLLYTKKNLTKYYWINIAERKIGLTGIISQSNLVEYKNIKGFFTYISLYLPKDDRLNSLNSKEILEYFLNELQKMRIKVESSDIIDYRITKSEYAQPLFFDNNDLLTVNLKTPIDGIYILNSHSLLPEDRGLNNIIQKANVLADLI